MKRGRPAAQRVAQRRAASFRRAMWDILDRQKLDAGSLCGAFSARWAQRVLADGAPLSVENGWQLIKNAAALGVVRDFDSLRLWEMIAPAPRASKTAVVFPGSADSIAEMLVEMVAREMPAIGSKKRNDLRKILWRGLALFEPDVRDVAFHPVWDELYRALLGQGRGERADLKRCYSSTPGPRPYPTVLKPPTSYPIA